MKAASAVFLSLFLLTSCAHVISTENRQAAQDVPFKSILANPDAHIRNTFILGGVIAKTTNREKETEIEVVQTPLDRYGSIVDKDVSEGRFLVITQSRLDPLIFATGRKITMSGTLTGSSKRTLGEIEYAYPVFEAKELHLWKEEKYYPYYYPGYPYGYDPFYYGYQYYWDWPYWRRPYLYPYMRP